MKKAMKRRCKNKMVSKTKRDETKVN